MNQRDDPSYELISAYLDGELTPDECVRVEQLVASDSEYRQTFNALREVGGRMKLLPEFRLDHAFAQRVIAAARDAGASFEAEPEPGSRPAPLNAAAHVWHWPAAVGFFATVAAAVLAALFIWEPWGEPSRTGSHQLISQAAPKRDDATGNGDGPAATRPDDGPSMTDRASNADQPAKTLAAGPESSGSLPGEAPPEAIPAAMGQMVLDDGQVPSPSAVPPSTSTPAPAHVAMEPSAAPSPGAAGMDSAGMDNRPLAGHVPLPGEPQQQERVLADVPFSSFQQMLMVVDVALTPQGLERGAFERALAAHDIAIERAIPVDAKLEESLLASRYFDPVEAQPGEAVAARTDLTLIYVKTQAGHIERVWQAMQSDHGNFSTVSMDLAFLADDQALFQELRRAAELRPVGASTVPDAQRRARRAAAHRITLSPSWRGRPVSHRQSADGRPDPVPNGMLDKDSPPDSTIEKVAGQPDPKVPLPPGGRLGENIEVEVLLVVHVGRIQD